MRFKLTITGLLAAGICFLPTRGPAPGSFHFDDQLKQMLSEDALGKAVSAAFEFQESGSATRMGSHFKHLGGQRIAPYEIGCRPKGSKKGDYPFTAIIKAQTTFLDAKGKNLSEESQLFADAASVKEKITSIEIFTEEGFKERSEDE